MSLGRAGLQCHDVFMVVCTVDTNAYSCIGIERLWRVPKKHDVISRRRGAYMYMEYQFVMNPTQQEK